MKRYIFILDENYVNHCGSQWTMITYYKQFSYLLSSARSFLCGCKYGKYAYLMNDYTQKMCEMSPAEMGLYIKQNGKLLATI